MLDLRKNLIVITFLLIGVVLALLYLNFKTPWKNQSAKILDNAGFATSPQRISLGKVNFFKLSSGSEKIIFYEELDSIIYESTLDGRNKKEIARVKLPKNIKKVAFSPDGRKIAHSNQGSVIIANPDGSESKEILKTRIKEFELFWPEEEIILIKLENDKQILFSIDPQGSNLRKLTEAEIEAYNKGVLQTKTLPEEIKIEAIDFEFSYLKDYIIFTSARDGKLYSLKL